MKMIVAIVRPSDLEDIRVALTEMSIDGMTAIEAKGYGRQGGHTEIYRGAEYQVNFVPKIRVEVVVEDGQAAAVVDAIASKARSGKVGDGKIFTLPVEDALRVRTGETGGDAI